jgi:glycine/D-amino acid oxidase-like deaminating enzyme
MSRATAEAVVCGAGIAGIAAAWHLTRAGLRDVALVEAGEPLSLTSDKSTECYRNFWPGPGDGMVRLMNRSLDQLEALAEASGNPFHLNRRGYLYTTSDPQRLSALRRAAEESSALGAGPLRRHPSGAQAYHPEPQAVHRDGFDLIEDPALLRRHYPCLAPELIGALHVRRAGWFSAQQLGRLLLEQARAGGARLVHGQVHAVASAGGRIVAVSVATPAGPLEISTPAFVNAGGPFARRVAGLLGLDLPVECELHAKASFGDPLGAIPRHAPLLILSDPQRLNWSDEERAVLIEGGESFLLDELPSGVHVRPEGRADSPVFLGLWPYHTPIVPPTFPLNFDAKYAELVLRGLQALVPGVAPYVERMPRPYVDGGYYARTRENRPLIGPLGPAGSFVLAALSGFGLMAALGAGELLALHVCQRPLPDYAAWFLPSRYDDPAYAALLAAWQGAGQL